MRAGGGIFRRASGSGAWGRRAALVGDLKQRHGSEERVGARRDTGAELARERFGRVAGLARKERLAAVARLVDDLGGRAEVEGDDDHDALQGDGCPLGAVVGEHPEVCELTEAFVAGLVGQGTVRERRQGDEAVNCRLEIGLRSPER